MKGSAGPAGELEPELAGVFIEDQYHLASMIRPAAHYENFILPSSPTLELMTPTDVTLACTLLLL